MSSTTIVRALDKPASLNAQFAMKSLKKNARINFNETKTERNCGGLGKLLSCDCNHDQWVQFQ